MANQPTSIINWCQLRLKIRFRMAWIEPIQTHGPQQKPEPVWVIQQNEPLLFWLDSVFFSIEFMFFCSVSLTQTPLDNDDDVWYEEARSHLEDSSGLLPNSSFRPDMQTNRESINRNQHESYQTGMLAESHRFCACVPKHCCFGCPLMRTDTLFGNWPLCSQTVGYCTDYSTMKGNVNWASIKRIGEMHWVFCFYFLSLVLLFQKSNAIN